MFVLPDVVTKGDDGKVEFVTKSRGFSGILGSIAIQAIRQANAQWDEHKHPRNRGRFASKPGGGSSSAKPPALPRTPKAKPAAQPSGRKYNPKFGTKIPHPPSLPGKKQPSLPGSGHPPENIGNPKNESEAREHFIWLVGRAGILRRQGQSGTPLTPKQTKELTLSINLANRIHAQHFSDEAKARKESKEAGKDDDPFGMATVAERLKPIAELRPNQALDEFMASTEESKKPKPRTGKTDLRHNPLLDELFGKAFTLPSIVKISPKST